MVLSRRSGSGGLFGRAMELVRPYRKAGAGILLLGLLGAALGAVEPWALKEVIDAFGAPDPAPSLIFWVAVVVGLGLLREAVVGVANWLTWRVRLDVNRDLMDVTVARLTALPVAFHRQESVGSIMTRLDRGVTGFVGALGEIVTGVLPSIAYLALSVTLMLQLDWRLTLLILAFAPLPAIVGALASPEQVRRDRALLDRWAAIFSRLNEVLSGIVTVKSFTMEEEERRRFMSGVSEANGLVARGVGRDSLVAAVRGSIALLARAATIGVGAWLFLRGEVTVGVIVATLGYLSGIFGPVQGLTGVYQTIRRASVATSTLLEVIDANDSVADAPNARELDNVRGAIDFDSVWFSYGNEVQSVLRDFDLHVEPGETIALVGASGSGKSTAMALLQRLYDPQHGAVRVDGHDLRDVSQRSLRTHVGVVLQECLLFNDSVGANIAYGRPEASRQEIEEAARAANIHDVILGLPEGYDTMVGERGSLLSVGQRQRIAIARALLKDPAILILDEATSALDAETEAIVQEALDRLVAGRTTLVVAHRLATVVNADRIVVLREGRVADVGDHATLMRGGGYYASLVERQTGGLVRLAS